MMQIIILTVVTKTTLAYQLLIDWTLTGMETPGHCLNVRYTSYLHALPYMEKW